MRAHPDIPVIPVSRSRRPDRLAVGAAGIVAIIVGWQGGEWIFGALRELWLHTLLPAFHILHIGGLPFCS